jgi:hypothetical protein
VRLYSGEEISEVFDFVYTHATCAAELMHFDFAYWPGAKKCYNYLNLMGFLAKILLRTPTTILGLMGSWTLGLLCSRGHGPPSTALQHSKVCLCATLDSYGFFSKQFCRILTRFVVLGENWSLKSNTRFTSTRPNCKISIKRRKNYLKLKKDYFSLTIMKPWKN